MKRAMTVPAAPARPLRINDAMDRLIPDVAGAGAASGRDHRGDLRGPEGEARLFAKPRPLYRPGAVLARALASSLKLADIGAISVPSRLVTSVSSIPCRR